jgi:hypothetical protein
VGREGHTIGSLSPTRFQRTTTADFWSHDRRPMLGSTFAIGCGCFLARVFRRVVRM